MDQCRTCKYWLKYTTLYPNSNDAESKKAGGFCQSENITEFYDDEYKPNTLVYTYSEGGSFWTGSEFGCVHHKARIPHVAEMFENFTDKRGREWEWFMDRGYYDLICARPKGECKFSAPLAFHFDTIKQAEQFIELLKVAS
jgi:hypothetical protein